MSQRRDLVQILADPEPVLAATDPEVRRIAVGAITNLLVTGRLSGHDAVGKAIGAVRFYSQRDRLSGRRSTLFGLSVGPVDVGF